MKDSIYSHCDSHLLDKATETIFYFEEMPIRVYHCNGELIGMAIEDVCKALDMTIEEATHYLSQELEVIQ